MGRFSLNRLKEKPFILITSLLATIGWSISFGGACVLKVLNGAWWVIIYQFLIILGHITVFSCGTVSQYKIAMMTFLASSIPLLTIQVDYVIQYNKPSIPKLPATVYVAGYIVLLIVQYAWIIVIGSDSRTALGQLGHNAIIVVENHKNNEKRDNTFVYKTGSTFYSGKNEEEARPYHETKQFYVAKTGDTIPFSAGSVHSNSGVQKSSGPLEYVEKVKAIHAYKASSEDPNELSFEKGELLEIADRKGNWWQARNSHGQTGIIPSNYFG